MGQLRPLVQYSIQGPNSNSWESCASEALNTHLDRKTVMPKRLFVFVVPVRHLSVVFAMEKAHPGPTVHLPRLTAGVTEDLPTCFHIEAPRPCRYLSLNIAYASMSRPVRRTPISSYQSRPLYFFLFRNAITDLPARMR